MSENNLEKRINHQIVPVDFSDFDTPTDQDFRMGVNYQVPVDYNEFLCQLDQDLDNAYNTILSISAENGAGDSEKNEGVLRSVNREVNKFFDKYSGVTREYAEDPDFQVRKCYMKLLSNLNQPALADQEKYQAIQHHENAASISDICSRYKDSLEGAHDNLRDLQTEIAKLNTSDELANHKLLLYTKAGKIRDYVSKTYDSLRGLCSGYGKNHEIIGKVLEDAS